MIKGFLNVPWFVWAVLALVIATTYSFIWPHKKAAGMTGIQFLIVRWGHTLTWLLLAANFILRGISSSLNGAANLAALAAGMIYVLFVVTTFTANNAS